MKISKFIAVAALCVAALSAGVNAQVTGAKLDSASVQVASAPAQKPAQSKQTSVQRPTKKTNWSKIKTLFE
ncbi:MAG: hypothetical protein LBB74_08690 [Chitinispirillales bacterium]|jgi:hypothetical protein|nr:hypothetical protein [Chitinispirillales bacterium]